MNSNTRETKTIAEVSPKRSENNASETCNTTQISKTIAEVSPKRSEKNASETSKNKKREGIIIKLNDPRMVSEFKENALANMIDLKSYSSEPPSNNTWNERNCVKGLSPKFTRSVYCFTIYLQPSAYC